ncbi:hypothetical protein [Nocardioides sp. HB32]
MMVTACLDAQSLGTLGDADFWKTAAAPIVSLMAAATVLISAWRERVRNRRLNEVQQIRAQLNSLYGPLKMLREESRQLRKMLPSAEAGGPAGSWRLVDHIADVKQDPKSAEFAAVTRILAVWTKVDTLLVDQAGLCVEMPPPESFSLALAHSSMLRLHWDLGINQDPKNRLPFAGEVFDEDINNGISKIKNRLKELKEQVPDAQ